MTKQAFCLTALLALAGCVTQNSPKDAELAPNTRKALNEQSEGINRGETDPYRAESAGKAYRAYVDSIGKPGDQAGVKSALKAQ